MIAMNHESYPTFQRGRRGLEHNAKRHLTQQYLYGARTKAEQELSGTAFWGAAPDPGV